MINSLSARLLFLLLACWSVTALAAPEAGRTYRLLILDSQLGNPYDEVRQALLTQLAQYGYRQGENLAISLHSAGNDLATGQAVLQDNLDKAHDVIFVGGTVATLAARKVLYGQRVPVVFGSPTDPVGIGVIDAFDQPPKANFTGVCYPVPVRARMLFIRQLLPEAKTFGLIYADMPQSHSYNRWLRELLANDPLFRDSNILFRSLPLITGENGDKRMAQQAIPLIRELDSQVDAFIKPNDQLGTRRHFAQVVAEHASKPLIGITKNDVMAHWGATAVVYPSHSSIGRQAADMIRDLFEGKSIADIPPQWPTLFGYAVDLRKTIQFGIKVPVGILQLSGENIVK
jgi:putative ABC transport system substrate-binding protein